ncbi:MAG: hypothetical protein IKD93_01835 [Firmicutes bacterium]|nr:hypothetical protein [Bacillota bacterium]
MKRYRWLPLILLLALMLLLTACGGPEPEEAAPETAAEQEAAVSEQEETPDTSAAGGSGAEEEEWTGPGLSAADLVFMRRPTTAALDSYDNMYKYIHSQTGQQLLLYCEQEIPYLCFIAVDMINDGGNIGFQPGEDLCYVEPLTPDQPLLVDFLPQGDLHSGFGVRFGDPDDPEREYFFILAPNGRGEPGDPPLTFQQIY